MAPSSFTLITVFSLAMVASFTEARMVPSQYNNGQGIVRGETTVEQIERLMRGESPSLSSDNSDCHTSSDNEREKGLRDFEPRPGLSVYANDDKLKGETVSMKDFERPPHARAYPTDDADLEKEKEYMRDFESRPHVPVYPNDDVRLEKEKEFVKDFESRPNFPFSQG